MAISNTNILIKRSSSTATPGSLKAGELAYSYNSNTAFIGSSDGNSVLRIGGQYYTDQIEKATSSVIANTIVRRDATGNVYANYIVGNVIGTIQGSSNSATYLAFPQDFSITGGDIEAPAISFNGSQAVALNASLKDVPGLTSGTYGSTTAIPSITVGANGRILAITTQSISTSFTLDGDSGSTNVAGGDTLYIKGATGSGIVTSVGSAGHLEIGTDTSILRSNTAISKQTVDGSLEINGDLTVLGTQTVVNTQTLSVKDPLLLLASNNTTSDVVDIGFAGEYNDGTQKFAGVFRNAGDKEFYVFDGYSKSLTSNNEIDVADASFHTANLNAGIIKSTGIISNGINLNDYVQGAFDKANTNASDIVTLQNVNATQNTNISNADTKAQGAFDRANASVTSTSTLTAGAIVIGAGSNNVTVLANTTFNLTGALGSSNTISSLTVDEYGRVTAATASPIAIDTSAITSGTLGYSRGGTGSTSYTTGTLLIAGASGFTSLANTTFTPTGSGATNSTITSLTVDEYGRVTAATYSAISGLTVSQGGTGLSSVTTNGITFGNGTGALGVTAAAGTADQTYSNQILTVNNSGVPVWTSALDGGTF